MIHFFLTFSHDASDSPFAHALRDLNIEYELFCGEVLLRYRHRIWLFLVGLPKLGGFALRSAWRSLAKSSPVPDAIVVGSHLEALICAIMRRLLRRNTRIYLLGFIFTRRNHRLIERLRQLYFGNLFAIIDGILCHSSLEVKRYQTLFPRGQFVFVPYGLHIHGYEEIKKFENPAQAYALSAGRSGRDYPILFKVFADAGYPLHVVCDAERTLQHCLPAPNITILRNCYDDAYSQELRGAGMVIIPLAVDDISAGQMVLIQAMAYRKPIIATRTPALEEYLTHGVNALLVPPSDAAALRVAIDRLHHDPALAARLADHAFIAFRTRHCMRVFVENIVRAVASMQGNLLN